MTVDEIMELTNQKRGTIDQFRMEIQKYGLIEKHQALDLRAVTTFRKAVEYREAEQNTWSDSIQRAIQEEYGEEMKLPFIWTKEIILKNLLWQIENKKVDVVRVDNRVSAIGAHNEDFHIVYEVMISNFREMGKTIAAYNNSSGTDGNPVTTFVCKGKDYIYYLIGKYNTITKSEDIHVFYNDGIEFNIMKCEHICGGNSDKGNLDVLWQKCSTVAPMYS
ncbi:hypothetical protein [Sporosarcina limicola]|uniref:Uncharacterized protein n=1 Tax=Sporosarcina limicola TaxID=34101 RepID=A0A927MNU1_9BACL|nr:hypothetical protein [Sporosarcina limicola]MBE1556287.1 hypothetical protein [Sporosarcina limicola]